jgi:tetratricopeptide (TPR) repeat protein
VLERQGLTEEAALQYRKSLELDATSASAHHNLAASLVRTGDLAEAERHFRAALAQKPSAQSYTGLALVAAKAGRVDEAIANLNDAIEADPEYPAAHEQLGAILAEQGRLEEAARSYEIAVRKAPSAAAREKLAQILARLGRTDDARKQMEAAKATAGAR